MKIIQNHIIRNFIYFIIFLFPVNINCQQSVPYLNHCCGGYGGMFAVFASVLGSVHLYEAGHYTGVHINFVDGYYQDFDYGTNWWNNYFEPIEIGTKTDNILNTDLESYIHLARTGFALNKVVCNEIIAKYIHILPNIQMEIDHFYNKHFINNYIIGLHYRGTDKKMEFSRRSYEEAYECFLRYFKTLPKNIKRITKVYVATDEQLFLDFLNERIPDLIIYNDFVRSNDQDTALHTSKFYKNNYQKGKEGLIDCLMLSRCNCLIRPYGSCFSWASTLFNPNLSEINY